MPSMLLFEITNGTGPVRGGVVITTYVPKSERISCAALGISREIGDTRLTCLTKARSTKIVLGADAARPHNRCCPYRP